MTEPYTPDDVPPDTDEYVYRPVLRLVGGDFVTEYMQIGITQP